MVRFTKVVLAPGMILYGKPDNGLSYQKEVEKIIYSCDTEGNVYRLSKLKGSLALYTSDRIEKDFLLDMESVWDAS